MSKYARWERDAIGTPIGPHVFQLLHHERCLLMRRRAGFTQARVAAELKVCRWWVNKMERGMASCDELLWYWEQ